MGLLSHSDQSPATAHTPFGIAGCQAWLPNPVKDSIPKNIGRLFLQCLY